MNWLIHKKMFTYFYNKFRPENHMHYIKCGVNSSLLTYFWLLQKICGTLDHCFITTHSVHNVGDLQIYFYVIFHETRHHTQAHVTSCTLIHCPFFRHEKNTDDSAVGLMISLASDCYGDSWVTKHFFRTWSSNQSGGEAILALYSFVNQIPHQKEPEISVGIYSPTWR